MKYSGVRDELGWSKCFSEDCSVARARYLMAMVVAAVTTAPGSVEGTLDISATVGTALPEGTVVGIRTLICHRPTSVGVRPENSTFSDGIPTAVPLAVEAIRIRGSSVWYCSGAVRSRCEGIFAMTCGFSTLAMILSVPPQRAQFSIWMPNTRFSRRAQLIATCRGVGGWPGIAGGGFAHAKGPGTDRWFEFPIRRQALPWRGMLASSAL